MNRNNINLDKRAFSYEEIENRDYFVDWENSKDCVFGVDMAYSKDCTAWAVVKNPNLEDESRNDIDLSDLTSTMLMIAICFFLTIIFCGKEIAEVLLS